MDQDGYIWFKGRVDDVIMTSGERIGPFEIESKILEHPAVAEVGVIGKPDANRGEMIKAFIVLHEGFEQTEKIKQEIFRFIQASIETAVVPIEIEFRTKLPKTRSGKIMRSVLTSWEHANSGRSLMTRS